MIFLMEKVAFLILLLVLHFRQFSWGKKAIRQTKDQLQREMGESPRGYLIIIFETYIY